MIIQGKYIDSIKWETKVIKGNNKQEKHCNKIEKSLNHKNWTWNCGEENWMRSHPLNLQWKKNKCTSFSMLIVWNDLFESISKRQRGVLSCPFLAVTKSSLIMPSSYGGNRSNHSIPSRIRDEWLLSRNIEKKLFLLNS